jgi:hypothetical protein
MIFAPENPADAAEWAAVLAGHFGLGIVLACVAGATVGRFFGRPALSGAQIASVAYAGLWEGLWQRLGAGIGDAALDSFAVACGAFAAAALWERKGAWLAGAVVAVSAVMARGIGRRR